MSLIEMQVLEVAVQAISTSRVFHGLNPAVGKALIVDITTRVAARRADPMEYQQDDVG
jgi:hypothetical protein